MFTKLLLATLLVLAVHVQAFAEATIPTKDIAGAKDNPLIKRYEAERSSLVQIDHSRLRAMGLNIVERDLLAEDGVVRHDPDRLARAVFELGKL